MLGIVLVAIISLPEAALSETALSPDEDPAQSSETSSDQPASLQPLQVDPGYYSQVNQNLGAELPIYDSPSTNASVLVQLPGDTILASDGQQKQVGDTLWQHVSLQEIEGWVHADKLKLAEPISFTGTDLPVLGVCGGTEPSWSIEWDSSTVTYSNISGLIHRVPFQSVKADGDNATSLQAGDDSVELKMTVTKKQCSYTPLDSFVWGEAVATITQPGQEPIELKGCCRPVSDGYR
ncbi:hypothetical protein GCM10007094_16940 [Pseudovibrio japonicus]|uniref:SH3b domain-containing protein n=1 Tax=Pseudovibrio japonicus TaxID=366534 RepID=A0ABQ3E807_9HYPH|nr:hypothetical protein GCM10007094_16940 [Pseudovibrio japonicus]